MFRVVVRMGEFEVRLETDGTYPDCANDVTNRAKDLLKTSVAEVKAAGWSPLEIELEDDEEDSDTPTTGFDTSAD